LQADGVRIAGIADVHEAARHHGKAVAAPRQEDAQRERPRLQPAVAPHRHGRKPRRILQHEVDAALVDRLQDALPPRRLKFAAAHAVAKLLAPRLARVGRGHHHIIDAVAHRRSHSSRPSAASPVSRSRQWTRTSPSGVIISSWTPGIGR
jgi:hypothetical protein